MLTLLSSIVRAHRPAENIQSLDVGSLPSISFKAYRQKLKLNHIRKFDYDCCCQHGECTQNDDIHKNIKLVKTDSDGMPPENGESDTVCCKLVSNKGDRYRACGASRKYWKPV